MSSFVAEMEDLTLVLTLSKIQMILHECSLCCRYRGSNMSTSIVADIVDLT